LFAESQTENARVRHRQQNKAVHSFWKSRSNVPKRSLQDVLSSFWIQFVLIVRGIWGSSNSSAVIIFAANTLCYHYYVIYTAKRSGMDSKLTSYLCK
jgi:hypothetical protein